MSSILFEIKNSIAYITLNRPDKFNSFNREMALLLQNKLDECASLQEVRCVYITGTGKAFCAGQDIGELVGENKIELAQILSEHYNPIVQRIRNLPKPVVAAVNGVAAGAGLSLALACDVRIMNASAKFVEAFIGIALIPDSGATFFYAKMLGYAKAFEFATLNKPISADEALALGMVNQVLHPGAFADGLQAMAKKYAEGPTQSYGYVKLLLQNAQSATLEHMLELEAEYQQLAGESHDYAEGVKAFIEKRAPEFLGR